MMPHRLTKILCVFAILTVAANVRAGSADLADVFDRPPQAAKPWVYWFVLDGHQSIEGITADLEAMRRVGIGGLLMMEVDVGRSAQPWRVGRGPVPFMSPHWRKCFKHLNTEAHRLGLSVTLNAGPGWTGSGGPWVEPAQSMQKLVATERSVAGPRSFDEQLPRPETVAGYYRDVAVLAFPRPTDPHRIERIAEKALYRRGYFSSARPGTVEPWIPALAHYPALSVAETIPEPSIVDLTEKMDADGRLTWQVPPGQWTIIRFGHTSTGKTTRPAPKPGLGLECDKMDRAALDAHFDAYFQKLLDDLGPLVGESLVALHVDSWEMGPQNWTARMPDEFQRRRGYSIVRYLPVMQGYVVDDLETSERFLWDLRQTALELISENYSERLAEHAHRHGLRLSIEPYDCTPCDDMTYGARADVPMCEFWSTTFNTWFSAAEATSVAHTYGKPIVQAEAFTAGSSRAWQQHPRSLKTLGDVALCEGINRLVVHRYAHQPWLDRQPGMTMGPYGIHYERTNTWWELSKAWTEYLARCQAMLQQGRFVADVLYLMPEASPQAFRPFWPAPGDNPNARSGYNYDGCTPEALLTRASVRDGRIVMPDGMSYRALFLPKVPTMTPALLAKIERLADEGATIVGPRPMKSPSLGDGSAGDRRLRELAEALWGDEPSDEPITERAYGRGRVIGGERFAPSPALLGPTDGPLDDARWIWYPEGNPARSAPPGRRFFARTVHVDRGKKIEAARLLIAADNRATVWLNGRRAGRCDGFDTLSTFDVAPLLGAGDNRLAVAAENTTDKPSPAGVIAALVIRYHDGSVDRVATDSSWLAARSVDKDWRTTAHSGSSWTAARQLGANGTRPWPRLDAKPPIEAYASAEDVAAVFERIGLAPDFESTAPLRHIHRRTGKADVYFVVNTRQTDVSADCTFRVAGRVPEIWDPLTGRRRAATAFAQGDGRTTVPLRFAPAGSLFVVFREPTDVAAAAGDNFPALRPVMTLAGPWSVAFDPRAGGPAEPVVFAALADWATHAEAAVKYFSGTAVYRTSFDWPEADGPGARRCLLDLGRVEVMAQVVLNGRELGTVWAWPLRVDISEALRRGENTLEIRVVNLWPNRLIGDAGLDEKDRHTWSSWSPYRKGSPLVPSGLLGPVRLLRQGTSMPDRVDN